MHDAVVRALTAESQFSPGTNFKAWIFTILRNLYYNRWREQRVRSAILEDPTLAGERLGPPQEAALKVRDFKRAFWQLGQDQREALILVGASGMSYEEAAAICQCPVGTVKSRVSRARQQLMQHHHADRAPPDHVEVDDTSPPGDGDCMLSDDAPPRALPSEEPRQRLPRRGKSVPHHAALRVAK